MKKIFVLFFAILYFVAGSGLLLRQHYCGGEYVGTQVDLSTLSETEMCSNCGMEEQEQDGCCENKASFVKKTIDDQVFSFQVWDCTAVLFDSVPNFIIAISHSVRVVCVKVLLPLEKPPPKPIAIFKKICCFRI